MKSNQVDESTFNPALSLGKRSLERERERETDGKSERFTVDMEECFSVDLLMYVIIKTSESLKKKLRLFFAKDLNHGNCVGIF